jgi:voltage-gated potassium channel
VKRGREQLAIVAIGFLAVVAVGTVGYMLIEQWDVVDSLYMTVITLTTVGFGEVHSLSRVGRVFTTALIIVGVAWAAYSVTVVGQLLLDGTVARIVRRRRMEKRISGLSDHYIVCGCGRTGGEVVKFLQERKIPFVVIDVDPEVVERLRAERVPVVEGNGHDEEMLEHAGFSTARAVVACASSDAENVFIALTARSMRSDIPIACRSQERDSESKLRRAGATHVINPYAITGRYLITSVHRPAVLEFFESTTRPGSATDFQEFIVDPEAPSVGKTIGQLAIGRQHHVSILAVRRHSGTVVTNPGGDTQIDALDSILALGSINGLKTLRALLEKPA